MTTAPAELLAPRVARQAGAEVRDRKQRDREVACDPGPPPRAAPACGGRASSFDSASVFLFSVSFFVLSVTPFVNVTVASVLSVSLQTS